MKIKTFYFIKLPIFLITLFVNSLTNASEISSLDAHVHCLSEMTIAVENHTIEINFISPAANIVGFEHMVTTAEEIAAVEAAEVLLKRHKTMFEFSEAQCELESKSINLSSLTNDNEDHHANEGHHSDEDHQHKGEHSHRNEHQHQGIEKHDEHIGHSEVMTNYRYHCENTPDLLTITVGIFKLFPGVQKIKAIWLTETQQSSAVLNEKNNIIHLR